MLPEVVAQEPAAIALDEKLAGAIIDAKRSCDEVTLVIDPARLEQVCRLLKQELNFERVSSITAVDWWPQEPRFEVVYHLHSLRRNARLRLKIKLAESDEIESVTHVWRGANWYEREVFDLFGIRFRNHPSLERILMPADWEGYPLRKDYPVHGYKYSYSEE